jgi:hypothetical protein
MSFSPVPTGGVNVPSLLVPGNSQLAMFQGGTAATDAATGFLYAPAVMQLLDSAGTNVAGIDAHHSLQVVTVDSAGTNKAGVDAYHNQYITDGGSSYVGVTASSAAAVKATAGRLCKVVVLTTVTSAVSIYDNTNAASGQALLSIPTTAAVGTIFNVQALATNGLYVGGGAGSPGMLVTLE